MILGMQFPILIVRIHYVFSNTPSLVLYPPTVAEKQTLVRVCAIKYILYNTASTNNNAELRSYNNLIMRLIMLLTLSLRGPLSYRNQFYYMITASVIKALK